MKIKHDFVTNSSSTGFIVCIPQDFVPTIEEITKLYIEAKNTWDISDFEELTIEKAYKTIKEELIGYLQTGDNLWYYDYEGTHPVLYEMVVNMCENNGFLLSAFEISSEGNNRIQGIRQERIDRWIVDTKLEQYKRG